MASPMFGGRYAEAYSLARADRNDVLAPAGTYLQVGQIVTIEGHEAIVSQVYKGWYDGLVFVCWWGSWRYEWVKFSEVLQ